MQVHQSEREPDRRADEFKKLEAAAKRAAAEELAPCPHCGRTFLPERLEVKTPRVPPIRTNVFDVNSPGVLRKSIAKCEARARCSE